MTLSTNIQDYVIAFEQEYGKKLSPEALRVIEHIEFVGGRIKELGKKDAILGRDPYTLGPFCDLCRKVFRLESGCRDDVVDAVADLWLMYYTDSYNAAKDGDYCES